MVAVNAADHVGLVYQIAHGYKGKHPRADVNELASIGTLGLMRAVQKFDPTRGTQFSTYAAWWITAEIRKFVDYDTVVHLSRANCNRGKDRPIICSFDKVQTETNLTLHDLMPDRAPGPEQLAIESERRAIVRRAIQKIPKLRNRQIMRMRFYEDMKLEEIGEEFGLSKERIRQIIEKELARIKPYLEHLDHEAS